MLLGVGFLVGLGTAVGYGIGRAVDVVRDLWPEPRPDLTAPKAAPPEPIDLSGPADTCTASAVALDLAAGATTLAAKDVVPFTLRVTNEGRMPCLLDGRASSMQVVVTDAAGERVWSSADCSGGGGADLLLGIDHSWDTTVRWSGSTSAPGCEGKREPVPPGDYTAEIVLDDVPDATGEPVTVTVAEPPAPEPAGDESAETDEDGDAGQDEKKADEKKADEEDPPAGDHEKKD